MNSLQYINRLFIILIMSTMPSFSFANDLRHTIADVPLNALWNHDRTAAVSTLKKHKGTQLFIFLKRDEQIEKLDISHVEGMNLGKVGRQRLKDYDRVESTPIEWVTRDDDKFQINIQTRAWKNGNRMTVSEPLVFDSLGQVYWR